MIENKKGMIDKIKVIDIDKGGLGKLLKNANSFVHRIRLLEKAGDHLTSDGLQTLKYKLKGKQMLDLYTQIDVDLLMTPEERNLTSLGK